MSPKNKFKFPSRGWGHSWPSAEQELLLQAALLKGQAAVEAWQEWKASVDIGRLDQGSRRLLPLLYHNLRALGIDDPRLDIFKGIYRVTWYKNQKLFRDMAVLLDSFQEAGIETLLLKGAALIPLYYKDPGFRFMGDFDLLVRLRQARAAMDRLIGLGWSPLNTSKEKRLEKYVAFGYEKNFENGGEWTVDLHWNLFYRYRDETAEEDYWEKSGMVTFHGRSARVLDATDQLFHTCVHGARWNAYPSFYWIADAIMILNASWPAIDWDRLAERAERHRLILPLRYTLDCLQKFLDKPISPSALSKLRSAAVTWTEYQEFRVLAAPLRLAIILPNYWFSYCRFSTPGEKTALPAKLVGFLRYLQNVWALPHLWQVPFYAFFRGIRVVLKKKDR